MIAPIVTVSVRSLLHTDALLLLDFATLDAAEVLAPEPDPWPCPVDAPRRVHGLPFQAPRSEQVTACITPRA